MEDELICSFQQYVYGITRICSELIIITNYDMAEYSILLAYNKHLTILTNYCDSSLGNVFLKRRGQEEGPQTGSTGAGSLLLSKLHFSAEDNPTTENI